MKTSIDPDFSITDDLRVWASKNKFARLVDIDEEHGKFVDYWLSRGTKMASWPATWRNWMRRAPKMGGYMLPLTPSYRTVVDETEEERAAAKIAFEDQIKRFTNKP